MRTDGVLGPLTGQMPTRPTQPSRPASDEARAEERPSAAPETPEVEEAPVLRMVPTPAEGQALPSQEAAQALVLDVSSMIQRQPAAAVEAQGARLDEERVERLLA